MTNRLRRSGKRWRLIRSSEHNSSRAGSLPQDRSVSDRGRFYFLLAKSFAELETLTQLIYLRKAKKKASLR
jgi:hypothetical protein